MSNTYSHKCWIVSFLTKFCICTKVGSENISFSNEIKWDKTHCKGREEKAAWPAENPRWWMEPGKSRFLQSLGILGLSSVLKPPILIFFKSVEITSQAALRKSQSQFLQWRFPYNNGDIYVTEWTHPCLVKKAKVCYSVSFILLFIGWGRKASSYFKIQGSLTVQPEIMPFSCAKGLKKVCPDFLRFVIHCYRKQFSFQKTQATSKRTDPREDFLMKRRMV